MGLKVKRLVIRNSTSDKWLERCSRVLDVHLHNVISSGYLDKVKQDNIVSRLYLTRNGSDIHEKYAELISYIFETLGVVGIWKMDFVPGTVDPIIGVKIYGLKDNVNYAYNYLEYIIDGIDSYYEVHVKNLKKKNHVRRVMRRTLPHNIDARKRTNKNIENKINALKRIFLLNYPSSLKKFLTRSIIKFIQEKEAIDYKKFRNMKTPSKSSMYSRFGKIQLNRLV